MVERVQIDAGGRTWTPAQILALLVGVAFVVLGGVALLRTGVSGGSILEPTTTVAGLAYTPLLAVIELIFGLIMMSMGAFPGAADGIVFLGLLALAFGLLLVIEPTAFQSSIAAGRAHGWFYVFAGGITALTALVTPAVTRRVATRRVRESGPAAHEEGRSRGARGDTQRLDTREREHSPGD